MRLSDRHRVLSARSDLFRLTGTRRTSRSRYTRRDHLLPAHLLTEFHQTNCMVEQRNARPVSSTSDHSPIYSHGFLRGYRIFVPSDAWGKISRAFASPALKLESPTGGGRSLKLNSPRTSYSRLGSLSALGTHSLSLFRYRSFFYAFVRSLSYLIG